MKLPKPARRQNITTHEYNPVSGQMTVTFHDGRQYRYTGVPPEHHEGMSNAASRGKYLHTHIIGNYPHTKIEP